MEHLNINDFIDNYQFYKSKDWLEDILFDEESELAYNQELMFDNDEYTVANDEGDDHDGAA